MHLSALPRPSDHHGSPYYSQKIHTKNSEKMKKQRMLGMESETYERRNHKNQDELKA